MHKSNNTQTTTAPHPTHEFIAISINDGAWQFPSCQKLRQPKYNVGTPKPNQVQTKMNFIILTKTTSLNKYFTTPPTLLAKKLIPLLI
jgi:hypothetical protein